MKILRRSVALLLCAMMPFTMTGMMPASGAIKTVTYAQDEIDGGISLFATGDMITLNAGEGSVSTGSVILGENNVLPELPTPTRTGWVFEGWYTAPVTENYWGDETGETLQGLKQKYPDHTEEWYKQTTFTWIVESTGVLVKAGDQLPDGVSTLYAMYKPTTVKVYWHFNGWLNEPIEKEVLIDMAKPYGSPLAPYDLVGHYNWEGRTFLGWYDAPVGGNKWEFYPMNDYEMSKQLVTKELHLYAYWTGGPEASTLKLNPLTSYVEPGTTFQVSATYSPTSANIPTVTWSSSDPSLVAVESTNGLTATFTASKDVNVINGNKQVTITAKTAQGVAATATVTICHSWDNGRITKYPTCTTGDTVRYTCTKCGATRDVSHPAAGHRYTYVEVKATCTSGGYKDRVCVECGLRERASVESALGHSWSVQTVRGCSGSVTTRTCVNCGLTEVTSDVNDAAHDWETTPRVDKVPTCVAEGSQSYHCRNCDLTKDSSAIPADSSLHAWSDWEIVKESTETETGEETRVCSICGTTETMIIPKLPKVDITTDLPETVDNQENANSTLVKTIQKILISSSSADRELAAKITAAMDVDKTITAEVVVTPVSAPADAGKFEALFAGKNIQYMDIDIVVKADGEELGKITETGDVLTLIFALPEVEDNRIVCVLREHEGVVEALACQIDGDMVSFSTNKFSTFAIASTNDIAYASVNAIANQTYTGSEIKPVVKVMINGNETLVEGVDYTVSYKNNVDVGTATAVVTGIGDFAGSAKEVNFDIVGADGDFDSDTGTESGNSTSPKTGDETNLAFWVLMLALSGCGLSLTAMRKKKINR